MRHCFIFIYAEPRTLKFFRDWEPLPYESLFTKRLLFCMVRIEPTDGRLPAGSRPSDKGYTSI
jgi:hypothetical protein